jgi:ankyrin repeat protein
MFSSNIPTYPLKIKSSVGGDSCNCHWYRRRIVLPINPDSKQFDSGTLDRLWIGTLDLYCAPVRCSAIILALAFWGIKVMLSCFHTVKGLISTTESGRHQFMRLPKHRFASISLVVLVLLFFGGCSRFGPIHSAAMRGDLAKSNMLLKSDPSLVSTKDNQDQTPLHYAAMNDHKDVAQLLLENKADVNARTSDDWTPLHFAALNNHKDLVQLLLENKADVNAQTSYRDMLIPSGLTPLHFAASGGFNDVAQLLLKNKADVNAVASNNWTPLHYAVFTDHKLMVELLLISKANVNAKTSEGWTPLFIATSNFHNEVAELLKLHGGHE